MVNPPLDKEGIPMFWWSRRNPPEDPKTSFAGKTILITGANSGLGFEASMKFATLGASSLIFGVRSLQRGEEAKKLICQRTGYLLSNIKIFQLDMSNFLSVKKFAEKVTKEVPLIDVALVNAGIAVPSHETSPEGYEMSIQVNVLSTGLLAILLLPKLRQTAASTGRATHMEFTGSSGQSQASLDPLFLNLSPEENVIAKTSSKDFFNYMTQYSVSKLLLMYVMDGIVPKTLNNSGKPDVIVTTTCPGLCKTSLGNEFSLVMKAIDRTFKGIFARSAEEGSRSLVSGAALGPQAHGEFWSHDAFFT